jgi:hypothetical protein
MLLAVGERSHHRSDPAIGKLSVNFFNRRRVVIAKNFGDVCKDKLKRRPFTRAPCCPQASWCSLCSSPQLHRVTFRRIDDALDQCGDGLEAVSISR